MLRRVIVGSLVGTSLEWYDFFVHGTAAAVVFSKLRKELPVDTARG